MKYNVLWNATVGSHMWGMNHAGSDMDLFVVYIQPTNEILAGHQILKGKEEKYEDVDLVRHEIGHVVEQLQKGNINFLWGVMSPIVEFHDAKDIEKAKKIHENLKTLIKDNLSKNYIHSITGLVRQNLSKYYGIKVIDYNGTFVFDRSGDFKIDPLSYKFHKKIKLMFRTLMQGYLLISKKTIDFPNVEQYEPDLNLLESLYKDTMSEYKYSELPEKPEQAVFDEFLVNTRMDFL